MKIIDLSYSILNESPTYPTDPKIEIKKEKSINVNGSMLHSIKISTHTGTHLDVPAHIIEGGKNLSNFSLDCFMGKAIKVNKDNYKSISILEYDYDTIVYETHWYQEYSNPDVFFGKNRPDIPEGLIKLVLKKGIKIFCCDLPSVDKSGSEEKPVHNALLGKNIIIYESLNNLNLLPDLKPFDFYGLPLSLGKVDGSPIRAIGILQT
jgi:kynurenine formamidase